MTAMSTPTSPATPIEAEHIAAKFVGEYLNACRMAAGDNEAEMIGNYLMKLVSVAGVVMAQAEGSETASERLQGTADFIANNMPRQPSRLVRVQ